MIRYSLLAALLLICSCSRQEPQGAVEDAPDYVATSNYLSHVGPFSRATLHALKEIDKIYVIVLRAVDESNLESNIFSQGKVSDELSLLPQFPERVVVVKPGTSIPDGNYGDPRHALLYVRPIISKRGDGDTVFVRYYLNRRVVYPWNNMSEYATVDSYRGKHYRIQSEGQLAKDIKTDIMKYLKKMIPNADTEHPSNQTN